jgi:riboflavin kinase/FMN adenylyltransferase
VIAPRIARSAAEAAGFGPCALTIGNFDGVHRGHQALLRATAGEARARGLAAAAMMFDPHPACVVSPQRAPRLLTSIEQRCALLAAQGIDAILILPFTPELARLTPEEFAVQFLCGILRAAVVLVGENFRFGRQAAGDTATLRELGARLGFETRVVPPVRWRGQIVSASEVRRRVLAGDLPGAGRLLARPYEIAGAVVPGHGIGSRQTVPTLNLSTEAQVLPARGVYVTRTTDAEDGRRWNSITNVGYRPTFGGDVALSIETFLLDPFDGRTPARIRLAFLYRLRDERRFESPEALRAQILRDAARARAYFRRCARWVRPAPRNRAVE